MSVPKTEFSAIAFALAGAVAFTLPCRAQDRDRFHLFTLDAGAGWTAVYGSDRQNIHSFPIYQAGAGVALVLPDTKSGGTAVWFTVQFLYGGGDLTSPLSSIVTYNPQNPVLQSATQGNANFVAVTGGPRFQHYIGRFSVYAQPSAGWLRRSIDLTGASTQGTAIQPNSPTVFRSTSNSGVGRISGGITFGKSIQAFVEVGLLQGFAINHGTLLVPMLSGGIRW